MNYNKEILDKIDNDKGKKILFAYKKLFLP